METIKSKLSQVEAKVLPNEQILITLIDLDGKKRLDLIVRHANVVTIEAYGSGVMVIPEQMNSVTVITEK